MKNLRENKTAVIVSLIIPILMILGFMMYEIISVATGDKVELIVQGYDPTDFLRGHYIRYSIINDMAEEMEIYDPENLPTNEDSSYNIQGHISLEDTNNDGIYDSLGDFYVKKPNTPYINGNCRIYYIKNDEEIKEMNHRIYIDYHQDRYYLNENLAPIVEDEIREAGSFSIVGTVKSGYFRASHIDVAGKIY